jgi:hypothetical protein
MVKQPKLTLFAWGLGLTLILLALAQTHPLWQYFTSALPYGYHVVPGYELMPNLPGDHMQFYYWSWLMQDNLLGPSAFLSNPYEFNTFISEGIKGFANFPFSLSYVLFSPLGPITAYNCMVILSYLLSGICAYALARELLQDKLAALPAALIFALLPFRGAQVISGHLYGFVAFMLPLTLWCLERGLKRRSILVGSFGRIVPYRHRPHGRPPDLLHRPAAGGVSALTPLAYDPGPNRRPRRSGRGDPGMPGRSGHGIHRPAGRYSGRRSGAVFLPAFGQRGYIPAGGHLRMATAKLDSQLHQHPFG